MFDGRFAGFLIEINYLLDEDTSFLTEWIYWEDSWSKIQ